MTDVLQVQTTLPSREQANEMARRLVEDSLAACVQVLGPIASTYRWEGKLQHAEEWLLLAKTSEAGYAALEQTIRAAHPYELPEIIAVEVCHGSEPYLAWIQAMTGGSK